MHILIYMELRMRNLPLRKRVHNCVIDLQAAAVFEMIVVHFLLLLAITHQCLGELSQAMYTCIVTPCTAVFIITNGILSVVECLVTIRKT